MNKNILLNDAVNLMVEQDQAMAKHLGLLAHPADLKGDKPIINYESLICFPEVIMNQGEVVISAPLFLKEFRAPALPCRSIFSKILFSIIEEEIVLNMYSLSIEPGNFVYSYFGDKQEIIVKMRKLEDKLEIHRGIVEEYPESKSLVEEQNRRIQAIEEELNNLTEELEKSDQFGNLKSEGEKSFDILALGDEIRGIEDKLETYRAIIEEYPECKSLVEEQNRRIQAIEEEKLKAEASLRRLENEKKETKGQNDSEIRKFYSDWDCIMIAERLLPIFFEQVIDYFINYLSKQLLECRSSLALLNKEIKLDPVVIYEFKNIKNEVLLSIGEEDFREIGLVMIQLHRSIFVGVGNEIELESLNKSFKELLIRFSLIAGGFLNKEIRGEVEAKFAFKSKEKFEYNICIQNTLFQTLVKSSGINKEEIDADNNYFFIIPDEGQSLFKRNFGLPIDAFIEPLGKRLRLISAVACDAFFALDEVLPSIDTFIYDLMSEQAPSKGRLFAFFMSLAILEDLLLYGIFRNGVGFFLYITNLVYLKI